MFGAGRNRSFFRLLAAWYIVFAFNNNFSDYGATIILQHQLDTVVFYTLYGHVSLVDIASCGKGNTLAGGANCVIW
jgi:hypothetical protein